MPSYTMCNPYKEVGHVRRWGSWQGRAVGDGELEPFGSVTASSWTLTWTWTPRSGCVPPVESQGRRDAAGLCCLLTRGRRGVRREPAASDSRSRAPRCPSGVNVPGCHADGHEVWVKTEGWVASSYPTASPGFLVCHLGRLP